MKNFLSLAVLTIVAAAAGPVTALASELVAHWDFEHFDDGGTTIKSTVGGYVGTVFGKPAIVPITRPGGGGNGLDISGGGEGGYIEVDPATSPDNMVNKAAADDAMSIVFWEKNNRSPADGCCDASTFWADSPSSAHESRGVNIHVPWSNGEIMFDTTGCCTAGTRVSITPAGFDFTQWHHYAFIKNGVSKQIWIDGKLFKEGGGQDPLPNDFALTTIGAQGAGDGHHSPDATIDDFAIYKGALTEAEIQALAAGAPIGGPPKAELIALWDFEKFDDGGTTIKSTVGGYVGTVFGKPAIISVTHPGGGGNGLDISGGGEGGYIEVDPATSPDNLMNKATADNAMSIVFWEKNNRSPADGCCDASTFWADSPSSAHESRGVNIHVPWSNGEIMFDTAGCCTAGTRVSITPAGFDFTQWHHYAFIKNGVSKQIWIDGNLFKEGGVQDPLPQDFALVTIGAQGAGDGHHSPDATIDDFAIYKGALTEAEIKALAAGGGTKPPDTVAPVIVAAAGGRRPINTDPVSTAETVTLTFSEEVAKPGATNVANYLINPSLAISKAEVTRSDTVVLTTAKPAAGTLYTVTVNGVQDTSKNLIAANSTAKFVSFSLVTNGILRFALYGNITDTGIDSVTSDPRYPSSPDFTGAATALDNTTVVPDDSMVHYGATITGLLTPTETGDYDFFIRGNQAAQLFLNPAGSSPTEAEVIASDNGASKNFLEPGASQTTQAPINLVAGKQYFVQLIYKREANSGDLCQVAWRKTTDTTAAARLEPIPGRFFTAEPTLGPSPAPLVISVSRSPGSNNLTLTWTGGGTLQRADSVTGSWTDVAGAASPHLVTASGSAGYFRIKQ
jgi:hypothetical protein